MNLFFSTQIDKELITIEGEEHIHCVKSLRKKEGQSVFVTDGKGHLYECLLSDREKNHATFKIIAKKETKPSENELSIAIGLTKNMSRIEWFIEKAVEIGIHKIIPIVTQNSERSTMRKDRLERIAISAMKQSQRLYLPEITDIQNLEEFKEQKSAYDRLLVAHYSEEAAHLKDCLIQKNKTLVLVGPEGDFTSKELIQMRDYGFQEVILGGSRLRTETAGVVVCTIFNSFMTK